MGFIGSVPYNFIIQAIMRPFHLRHQQLTSNEDANSDDAGSKAYLEFDSVEVSPLVCLNIA